MARKDALSSEEDEGKEAAGGGERGTNVVDELLEGCLKALQELEERLDDAVRSEAREETSNTRRKEGERKRTVVVRGESSGTKVLLRTMFSIVTPSR